MTVAVVIPARYASVRFPGKALVPLRDGDGLSQTLVRRTWEAAQQIKGIDAVFVATDDPRIAEHVAGFGGQVIMTPSTCANGTERCAAALDTMGIQPNIVVNLQGDAPLTPPWFVEDLVRELRKRPDIDLATPVLRCDRTMWQALMSDRMAGRIGGTTAVFNSESEALYFSKEVIPHIDPATSATVLETPVFHHVGVYAYRPDVLAEYGHWCTGPLEQHEGLEQLRFLEQGRRVLCVEVDARGREFWELNNPEDVAKIERVLQHA